MVQFNIINRVNPRACENTEWCAQCGHVYNCYEQRVGKVNRIEWPLIAIVVLIGALSVLTL